MSIEDVMLRLKHAVTHNETVNSRITPLVKAALCFRQSDLRRISPAFNPCAVMDPLAIEGPFHDDRKILVCGLPKSGNTWLSVLLAEYFYLPLIHPFIDCTRAGVGMNHFPPGIDILYRTDIVRCFYIIRDMRDAICSFFHYAKTPYHLKNVNANYNSSLTIEKFYFDYFLGVVIRRYKWIENADRYRKLGVPSVRYEDLLDNTEEEFRRLLTESRVIIDDLRLKEAVSKSRFGRLQKKGAFSDDSRMHVPATHFRAGKSGRWRQELPASVVKDIWGRFGKYLRIWGYEE